MPANGESDGQRSSLVLGPKDRLKGSLYVEGDLVVAGTVDGELEATGSVEIDGGGKVSGPVTARNRLIVGPSGSLIGDVRVARLIVQDGANFSGNVTMGKGAKAAPAPAVEAPAAATDAPEPAAETPAPAAAEAPAPAAAKAAQPVAAEAPKAPEAAKPAAPSTKPPTKPEAWQMIRGKGKSDHRKDRHR